MDLTKRQQEIFDFIRKYSARYGYPPTVRDIGKAVGLTSSSTVHALQSNLDKIGLLRHDPSKPRAIELLDRAVGLATRRIPNPAILMRSSGLEPPRAVKPTRPSTLRVYQFRHQRRRRHCSATRARAHGVRRRAT